MKRKVIITGGSSGIGLESARAFVENGDDVVICARDPEKLSAAREDLGEVEVHALDVTDQAAVESFFEVVGPADIVVANAGVCRQARLDDENSDEVWKQSFDVNVHGVYYCLKAAQRRMAD